MYSMHNKHVHTHLLSISKESTDSCWLRFIYDVKTDLIIVESKKVYITYTSKKLKREKERERERERERDDQLKIKTI